MENLEIIQTEITNTTQQIQTLFRSLNNPSNILLKKDRNWGKQTVQLFLRLDEISVTELEKFLPDLKRLLNKFHELRKKQSTITDQTDLRNAISPMAPSEI